jgi:hypothetical protein
LLASGSIHHSRSSAGSFGNGGLALTIKKTT